MERRRGHARALQMQGGRKIPRTPSVRAERPPPPEAAEVPTLVAKAAGELTSLAGHIRACEACARASADRAFGTGYALAQVMLVKDRPSAADVDSGNAFAEEAEALQKAFDALGIPLGSLYGSTAVRCGTAEAKREELRACSTHLLTEIESVRPSVLVAFGDAAVDAVRALDGRCGICVPVEVPRGERIRIRADLVLIATGSLPEGVTAKEAKRRLWRDLQAVRGLVT